MDLLLEDMGYISVPVGSPLWVLSEAGRYMVGLGRLVEYPVEVDGVGPVEYPVEVEGVELDVWLGLGTRVMVRP